MGYKFFYIFLISVSLLSGFEIGKITSFFVTKG